ncbi:MAG: hypothetical protein IJO55_12280 [Lachnospiraceae bacterium]|nr:hypothetical protein [Lachnospiraceae bacterium]
MRAMKKVLGVLLMIFAGVFCVSAVICFFAAVTGKLESSVAGETVPPAVFFAGYAVMSVYVVKFGWRLWKGNSTLQKQELKPCIKDGETNSEEWEAQGEELRKKLKPLLTEDRKPFAAYDLETIYYNKLQDDTDVDQFYYVPNEASVQLAIRKYQAYLAWRKAHPTGKDFAPNKVHIRVSSEKSLKGCDDFYYKQCLKEGMHIVMHTGPYTFLDVTEDREYEVTVKTMNDRVQDVELIGTWSFS